VHPKKVTPKYKSSFNLSELIILRATLIGDLGCCLIDVNV